MKISESLALAKFNTISSDSVSSGFGDLTVGKFPLGEACSSTIFKFLYPACLSTSGPILYEVPCRGVKAILKFALLDVPIFPFFIESSLLQKGNQLRVRFETIENEEDADAILKAGVYLPLTMLPKLTGKKFYFHEVIGFQVEDEKHGDIGIITGVNDTTAQPLFEVEFGTAQMLIPMLDQFIVKVDRENKIMFLKTPEGLVDMYI